MEQQKKDKPSIQELLDAVNTFNVMVARATKDSGGFNIKRYKESKNKFKLWLQEQGVADLYEWGD